MQLSRGIYFEYKPAFEGLVPDQHTYLVFRDGTGGERVIRGGIPENFDDIPGGAAMNLGMIVLGGDISAEVDIPLQESKDKYENDDTAQSRHAHKLDLGGRDAEAVWNDMAERARKIEPSDIDYNLGGGMQNSNSVVRAALEAGKIDAEKALPPCSTASAGPPE